MRSLEGKNKSYPSDIRREQFELIKLLLKRAHKKKTVPRRIDLYEVFCAVLTWSGAAVSGACCLRSLPSNVRYIRTLRSGMSHVKEAVCSGVGIKRIRLAGLRRNWGATLAAHS